jgi:hypothetical protein
MKARSHRGIHSIELVGGLLVLVPIVLYGIDYASVLYGGQMNASCCSAACRAAAQGPPTGYGPSTNTPKSRASTTLSRMVQPGAVIRVKKTVRAMEIVNTPIPQSPYGGPFLGSVTIKTRCDVFPPFLLPFVSKMVTLYTSQTYPWTYVMAANYGPTGANNGGGVGGTTAGGGSGSSKTMIGGQTPPSSAPPPPAPGIASSSTNDISQPIADSDP